LALDRISEWITLAFQTLSRPEIIRGSTIEKLKFTLYFNNGGESVSQLPLKDKAFLTFLGQNPPFELRSKTGVSPPIFGIHLGSSKYWPNPSISDGGGQQGWLAFVAPKAKLTRSNRVARAKFTPVRSAVEGSATSYD